MLHQVQLDNISYYINSTALLYVVKALLNDENPHLTLMENAHTAYDELAEKTLKKKGGTMPNEQEVEDMIASYTPEEADLIRDLLDDDDDDMDTSS